MIGQFYTLVNGRPRLLNNILSMGSAPRRVDLLKCPHCDVYGIPPCQCRALLPVESVLPVTGNSEVTE
jgi:hypothetical protein